MRRLLAVSALVAPLVVAFLATASGQPPTNPKLKPADDKKPNPTDADIAAALAHDADVKMAQAKIQLAEAELAKARQMVTLKVVTLKAKVEKLKGELAAIEIRHKIVNEAFRKGQGSYSEVAEIQEKLEAAKGSLAVAEAELKLLTGGAGVQTGGAKIELNDDGQAALRFWLATQKSAEATAFVQWALRNAQTVKGPIPDRLRAALDKPVKLGAKGTKVTFEKALEVFRKEAGLDVPVRGRFPLQSVASATPPHEFVSRPIEIVSEGEELPVGAWFQLFEDNAVFSHSKGPDTRFRFYVRDYGLLVAPTSAAPPDAPTLTDFWKQKPPAKETKEGVRP